MFLTLFMAVACQAQPVLNPANGHYYEAIAVEGGINWFDARTAADARTHQSLAGHLVDISSQAENDFIVATFPSAVSGRYWLGGYQDSTFADYNEPAGGWHWTTQQAFAYTNWGPFEPNNIEAQENQIHITSSGKWNDGGGHALLGGYIVEYDSIAPLPAPTPFNPGPPVLNPGNGHYYEGVAISGGITWAQAQAAAGTRSFNGLSGRLVAIDSSAENQFINTNLPRALNGGFWIGAFQDHNAPNYSEAGGGWGWVTGEFWGYTNWGGGEPNNGQALEDFAYLLSDGRWNDIRGTLYLSGYVVEYGDPTTFYTISGRVSNAQGQAIVGAAISRSGSGNVVFSNSAGYYAIPNVAAATYTIAASKSGYTFTPSSRSVTVTTANVVNQYFLGRTGVTVSGRISNSAGIAISGVTVTRSGSATPAITNGAGYYTFIDVPPGSLAITPSKSGTRFTPITRNVTVGSSDISGQNFIGATGYNVSGRIVNSSGSGIANLSVQRTGSNVGATTNSAGYYTFVDVPNGTFTLTPVGSGLSFNPESREVTVNGADVSGQNFFTAAGYSIIGRITNSSGIALAGVMVTRTGSGTPTFTNSAGYFTFNGVADGTYTLLPSADNTEFTPVTRTLVINGAGVSGQNFIGVPQ